MYTDELSIPDGVLSDPEAFEIMRLWAAHEELHVALNSDLSGGAEDFGEPPSHFVRQGIVGSQAFGGFRFNSEL